MSQFHVDSKKSHVLGKAKRTREMNKNFEKMKLIRENKKITQLKNPMK